MKPKFKLYDTNFVHHGPKASLASFPGHSIEPTFFEWERDPSVECEVAFFTDNCLEDVLRDESNKKIAWLLEPRELVPSVYEQIQVLRDEFDLILTHDQSLLSLKSDKIKPYIFGGVWSKPENWDNFSTNMNRKKCCIIVSHKRSLMGHIFRHQIVSQLANKYGVDVWGNGYRTFEDMGELLSNYEYCIVVENVKDGHWITEKALTALVSGCKVLYYGSEELENSFNEDPNWDPVNEVINPSIFRFNDFDSLEKLLGEIKGKKFQPIPYMVDLIKRSHLHCTEDVIYQNCIELHDIKL